MVANAGIVTNEGNVYVNQNVQLDGNAFIRCRFTGCKLIYSGGMPPNFSHCEFSGSQFYFEGAAGNTVAFLKAMSSPQSGLQRVLKDIFPDEDLG
jgi:hypothetical protein